MMSTSYSPKFNQSVREKPSLRAIPSQTEEHSLHLVRAEGQLHVHTAPFRGSFSIVLSEAIRSAGLGRRVLIAQFLKGGVSQGVKGQIQLCGGLKWLRPDITCCINEETTNTPSNLETVNNFKAVNEIWEVCKEKLLSGKVDQLVLDEIGLAIAFGYINEKDFIDTLEQKSGVIDVILTGPSIPASLIARADQITEMRCGI